MALIVSSTKSFYLPDSRSSGCLYLVASPIGNLGDISSRGIQTLVNSDFIACEDTRVTGKLLSRLEIQKKLISYREENEKTKSLQIALEIEQGKKVALLSDAGYPCISDPGFRLVRECHYKTTQKSCLSLVPMLPSLHSQFRDFPHTIFLPRFFT